MSEFLQFRKFITPILIQVLFWIGVVGSIIGGFVVMASDDGGIGPGLAVLILGPLAARIYSELLLLSFKIYEAVDEIRQRGAVG